MGLADVFDKEDRIEVTYSDFYSMVKESAKFDIIQEAYNRGHNPRLILDIMFETKEKIDVQRIGEECPHYE